MIFALAFGVLGLPMSWPKLILATFQSFWPRNDDTKVPTLPDLVAFAKRLVGTLYKYVIFPLPFDAPKDAKGLVWLIFREPCAYYPPDSYQAENNDYPEEMWFYINGVATTKDIADANRHLLFDMFGRPIHLLHNPSDSVLLDLLECVTGKTGLMEFGEIAPREKLKKYITKMLVEAKGKGIKKVVLISHSQGTIITGNTLTELGEDSKVKELMQEMLEVYNFANCAHKMPADNVAHLENISNKGDLVAWLGHFFPFPSLWIDAKFEPIEISGVPVVEDELWGHLLNSHYLLPMKWRGKYAGSKLVKEYLRKNKVLQVIGKAKEVKKVVSDVKTVVSDVKQVVNGVKQTKVQ